MEEHRRHDDADRINEAMVTQMEQRRQGQPERRQRPSARPKARRPGGSARSVFSRAIIERLGSVPTPWRLDMPACPRCQYEWVT